ncbi:hypothetical protein V2H43_11175, partial [Pasteurella multocida]|nr:hypothetical protein [Pasteurella multocida]
MTTGDTATQPAASVQERAPRTVTLQLDGRSTELSVLEASDGRSAIDVGRLTRDTGLTALDYGFVNTSATRSAITYIDGDEGILRYRG